MYLVKITITGEYKGDGTILIGGKPFLKRLILKTDVFEDEFLRLRIAEENGWFKIHSDNYAEFLASRGRAPEKKVSKASIVVETPVVETPVVETPVVETPVVETPVVETPVVETPVVETPVVETPVEPAEVEHEKKASRGRKKKEE